MRQFIAGVSESFDPLLVELSQKETSMEYIETILRYICHNVRGPELEGDGDEARPGV